MVHPAIALCAKFPTDVAGYILSFFVFAIVESNESISMVTDMEYLGCFDFEILTGVIEK
jgi:hypothetical protein